MQRHERFIAGIAAALLALLAVAIWDGVRSERPEEITKDASLRASYDAIVVGSDPEGVAAAVSAARNGLDTLLVDGRGRERLGGLFTLGWLNSLDMNYGPDGGLLNGGLFLEWFRKVEGDSFDVGTAERAFRTIAEREPKLKVLLGAERIQPIVEMRPDGERAVTGVAFVDAGGTERSVRARVVIDATQDADIAAEAGAPYTVGREDLGYGEHAMAVTLVFRLNGVTDDVWRRIIERLRGDDDPNTGANARSAWGYGEMKLYVPASHPERIGMRGLNLGRQSDDTALVNALHIFGVDALSSESIAEARRLAESELPFIVDELKSLYPEFAGTALDQAAPELYVRETRHVRAEYALHAADVCENRDHWDRIAFGSYPIDIQRQSPYDYGAVVCNPEQYAIPFRSLIPLEVDGLLVVGRAAGFDSLAHGSARVVPVGMATGQAAGAAVRVAKERGLTFRQLSADQEGIAELQRLLNSQGMSLNPFDAEPLMAPSDPAYRGFRALLRIGAVHGGYRNDFPMKEPVDPGTFVHLLKALKRFDPVSFPGDPATILNSDLPVELTLQLASATLLLALGEAADSSASAAVPMESDAVAELVRRGALSQPIADALVDRPSFRYADVYFMLSDMLEHLQGGKAGTL